MSQSHVQTHVELIARHEQEFLARRTPAEKFGDAVTVFAGSLQFVAGELATIALWLIFNVAGPKPWRFDPYPFPLLGTLVSVEALVLASLILARQLRMSRRGEERDHLMLQILLLTEKEVTAVLDLEREIARRIGLTKAAESQEMQELSQPTSVDEVAQTISETLAELQEIAEAAGAETGAP
jgi:uncharacterized membrane protein